MLETHLGPSDLGLFRVSEQMLKIKRFQEFRGEKVVGNLSSQMVKIASEFVLFSPDKVSSCPLTPQIIR